MRRLACHLLTGCALAALPAAASARVEVSPYVEVQQVVDAGISGDDLNGGNNTVTYTTLAAGVEANADGRLLQGTFSYRYEHEFGETRDVPDLDAHYGLARGQLLLVPNLLTLQAGAIATRTRYDIRGAAPVDAIDRDNISQVYGGYVGPDLATTVGPLAVGAGYRFSYVRADGNPDVTIPFGQPHLDRYDWSRTNTAYANVGMDTRNLYLPFGWTVSGGYDNEFSHSLSQRYLDEYGRADVTVPVLPTLALTGGAGWERARVTQDTPLLDANGQIVTDDKGRYVADPTAGRLVAFDTDGLYWDAGVVWKPSPRAELQVHGGKRYGSWAVTGSFTYQLTKSSGIAAVVYNSIDSFGRSLVNDLVALPTQFDVPRSGLTNRFGGCVFGKAGQGGCFDNALQSVATDNYRSRGAFVLWSASRGPIGVGLGAGYSERRYLTPRFANAFPLDGVTDRSWQGNADISYAFTSRTSLEGQLYVEYDDSGIRGAPNVLSGGGSAGIYHNFTDHLVANATAGVYAFDQQGFDSSVEGQVQVGARYQF